MQSVGISPRREPYRMLNPARCEICPMRRGGTRYAGEVRLASVFLRQSPGSTPGMWALSLRGDEDGTNEQEAVWKGLEKNWNIVRHGLRHKS